jgi:cytochrome c-type biogenesis protein CcmH
MRRGIAGIVKTLLLVSTLCLSGTAMAVEPSEVLEDPVLEARAREISKELRCLVCQNQDIDSSNAGLAKDLRVLVRERLVAGDTNEEVINFVVDRYGNFVLLKPPVQSNTIVLWLTPILLLLAGGIMIFYLMRRPATVEAEVALSAEDEQRLKDLTSKGDKEA